MMSTDLTLPVFGIGRLRLTTDGQGVTTLVGAKGCPLRCALCLNPHAWAPATPCRAYTVEQLIQALSADALYFAATLGGVTFGGGEPLCHAPFVAAFAKAKPADWRITLETSLHAPAAAFEQVLDGADAFIVDVKDMNPAIYLRYTGRDIAPALANLALLARRRPDRALLRVPLIPGYNTPADCDASERALRAMGFHHIDRFSYVVPPGIS